MPISRILSPRATREAIDLQRAARPAHGGKFRKFLGKVGFKPELDVSLASVWRLRRTAPASEPVIEPRDFARARPSASVAADATTIPGLRDPADLFRAGCSGPVDTVLRAVEAALIEGAPHMEALKPQERLLVSVALVKALGADDLGHPDAQPALLAAARAFSAGHFDPQEHPGVDRDDVLRAAHALRSLAVAGGPGASVAAKAIDGPEGARGSLALVRRGDDGRADARWFADFSATADALDPHRELSFGQIAGVAADTVVRTTPSDCYTMGEAGVPELHPDYGLDRWESPERLIGASRHLGATENEIRNRIPAIAFLALTRPPGEQRSEVERAAVGAMRNGLTDDLKGSDLAFAHHRTSKLATYADRVKDGIFGRLRHKNPLRVAVERGEVDRPKSALSSMRATKHSAEQMGSVFGRLCEHYQSLSAPELRERAEDRSREQRSIEGNAPYHKVLFEHWGKRFITTQQLDTRLEDEEKYALVRELESMEGTEGSPLERYKQMAFGQELDPAYLQKTGWDLVSYLREAIDTVAALQRPEAEPASEPEAEAIDTAAAAALARSDGESVAASEAGASDTVAASPRRGPEPAAEPGAAALPAAGASSGGGLYGMAETLGGILRGWTTSRQPAPLADEPAAPVADERPAPVADDEVFFDAHEYLPRERMANDVVTLLARDDEAGTDVAPLRGPGGALPLASEQTLAQARQALGELEDSLLGIRTTAGAEPMHPERLRAMEARNEALHGFDAKPARREDPIGFLAHAVRDFELGSSVTLANGRFHGVNLPLGLSTAWLAATPVQALGRIGLRQRKEAVINATLSSAGGEIFLGTARGLEGGGSIGAAAGVGLAGGLLAGGGASVGINASSTRGEGVYLRIPRNGEAGGGAGRATPAGLDGDHVVARRMSEVLSAIGELSDGENRDALLMKLIARFPELSVSVVRGKDAQTEIRPRAIRGDVGAGLFSTITHPAIRLVGPGAGAESDRIRLRRKEEGGHSNVSVSGGASVNTGSVSLAGDGIVPGSGVDLFSLQTPVAKSGSLNATTLLRQNGVHSPASFHVQTTPNLEQFRKKAEKAMPGLVDFAMSRDVRRAALTRGRVGGRGLGATEGAALQGERDKQAASLRNGLDNLVHAPDSTYTVFSTLRPQAAEALDELHTMCNLIGGSDAREFKGAVGPLKAEYERVANDPESFRPAYAYQAAEQKRVETAGWQVLLDVGRRTTLQWTGVGAVA
jgi:hypothetical protein